MSKGIRDTAVDLHVVWECLCSQLMQSLISTGENSPCHTSFCMAVMFLTASVKA